MVDEVGAFIDGLNWKVCNTLFHDVVLKTSGVHLDCMVALRNEGAQLTGNTFRNCGIMDLSMTWPDYWSPPPPACGNMTIEGNTFGTSRVDNGACCAGYSVALWATGPNTNGSYGVLHGFKIRNNYFEPGSVASGLIVRPVDDGTNVYCGNTGNVAAAWRQPC